MPGRTLSRPRSPEVPAGFIEPVPAGARAGAERGPGRLNLSTTAIGPSPDTTAIRFVCRWSGMVRPCATDRRGGGHATLLVPTPCVGNVIPAQKFRSRRTRQSDTAKRVTIMADAQNLRLSRNATATVVLWNLWWLIAFVPRISTGGVPWKRSNRTCWRFAT
jgi:hypothetical protein